VFRSVRQLLALQIDDALARGATLHTDWLRDSEAVPPLVLTGVPAEARLMTEESFGPVVTIAPFQDEAQAIELANSTSFALGAGIFIGDRGRGRRIAAQLASGACTIGDVLRIVGSPQAAFGGNRVSGYGRYHGSAGLLAFSRTKSVMEVTRPRARERHWFPFTARTFRLVRRVLLLRHRTGIFRKDIRNLFSVWLLFACFCSRAFPQGAAPLFLQIALPPGNRGKAIAYLLFSAPAGFPGDANKSLRHDFVPVALHGTDRQSIDLGPLPPGRYAVSVYLDVSGNRKLDRGFLGIPKEPVGASNDPRPRFGPPHFKQCSFLHGTVPQTLYIQMVK
jgi:uncharacterized protein (DUF2141 family)